MMLPISSPSYLTHRDPRRCSCCAFTSVALFRGTAVYVTRHGRYWAMASMSQPHAWQRSRELCESRRSAGI